MKYYICDKGLPKEVTMEEYQEWDENDPKSFLFPEYSKTIGDRIYTVQTMYEGDIGDEEEVRPFVIEYFEDSTSQVPEQFEEGELFEDDFIEYCATLEEFDRRYHEIVNTIDQKAVKQ